MKLLEQYQEWKERYNKYIILCKCGNFYDVFDQDTKILAYLMDYKINEYNGIKKLGFPAISLSKVLKQLEGEHLNYLIFEKVGDYYRVTVKKRFMNNQYENYIERLVNYDYLNAEWEEVCRRLKRLLLDPHFPDVLVRIKELL